MIHIILARTAISSLAVQIGGWVPLIGKPITVLLNALSSTACSIGAAHPLLLVLEDLQDADRGTLDLRVYLARYLAGTPLLVVGVSGCRG